MSGRTGGPPEPFVTSSEGSAPPEWMPDLIPAPPLRPLTPAVEARHDQPHLEISADDYTNAEDQVTEQTVPITDEQAWVEAAMRALDADCIDVTGDADYLGIVLRILWPLVAPLVTRAHEQADEIERWEDWSNDLTDLLPDMRDGDESQEFLIEQAIRALVTRAQAEKCEDDGPHHLHPGTGCCLYCERELVAVLRALDGDDERTQG